MTMRIPLPEGLFALVDDDDYERVAVYKWYLQKEERTIYAMGHPFGRVTTLHRYIMHFPDGEVDHIDTNKENYGLDCRKSNLRVATHSENMHHKRRHRNSANTYKGVRPGSKKKGTWQAVIVHNYKNIHLGTFNSEIEAARAYDRAAIKYFGEFALLNLPDEA